VIDELMREGAPRMLSTAIELEVVDYVEKHKHLRDEEGSGPQRPPPAYRAWS
jgi:hypothetical protein